MSVVCVVSQIYKSFFPFHSKTLKNLHKVHGGGQSVTFSSTPPAAALALGTNRASAYLAVKCAPKNLVAGFPIFYVFPYGIQNALVKVIWVDKNGISKRVGLHALQSCLVRLGASHGLDENITEAEVMGVMALSKDSYGEGRALIIPRYCLLIALKAQICARDFQFSFRIVLRFFNISPAAVGCFIDNKHINRQQVFKACSLRDIQQAFRPSPAGHPQAQYQSKPSHRCELTHFAASGNPNVKNNHERKKHGYSQPNRRRERATS